MIVTSKCENRVIAFAIAFVAIAAAAGCDGRNDNAETSPEDTMADESAAQQDSSENAEAVDAYRKQMQKDQSEHPTLEVGSPAPDFALLGTDDKIHSLSEYENKSILAVVFISNHCPASQMYESRIKALADDYGSKGLQVVAIAPNGPEAIGPSALNFTDVDDSFEAMKIRADFGGFNFPYLYDGETQSVSHQYGPKVTPHIFIFDEDRILRYEGRIDDRIQEEKVKKHDARAAIDQLLANEPVSVSHTPVFGCSTKWNSHKDSAAKEMEAWRAQPVIVEPVSLEGLTRLRANPTGKTLMVNFWATWCGSCRTEYPALLETYLWYRTRNFEFVSVSVDAPKDSEPVQRFLNDTHSAIRNLHVDTDDVYALMAAFDPTWESGVPFTMVIDPDGEVIFQHAGEVDILDLRRTILGYLPDAGLFEGNTLYWRR